MKEKKEYLDTIVIELDITKCKKTIKETMELVNALEKFSANDLKVKKIYFK